MESPGNSLGVSKSNLFSFPFSSHLFAAAAAVDVFFSALAGNCIIAAGKVDVPKNKSFGIILYLIVAGFGCRQIKPLQ